MTRKKMFKRLQKKDFLIYANISEYKTIIKKLTCKSYETLTSTSSMIVGHGVAKEML
jgi:hypothetical protein